MIKNIVCTESGIPQSVVSSLKKMGHVVDNKHIKNYIGLSGKIGNAMGIKIIYNKYDVSFDVGIDKRKDGWSTTHLIPSKK